ncbi:MAG: LamG domain-containing protein, partial [Planctomycetes bacterium]|nr:LamG domain-containing protein [Planctomycetota bacterium]
KHDAEVCLYVDGKQVKRQAFDGGDLKPTQAPVTLLTGFALTKDGQTTQQGAVRDVRLWSRALTPEEIYGVRSKH